MKEAEDTHSVIIRIYTFIENIILLQFNKHLLYHLNQFLLFWLVEKHSHPQAFKYPCCSYTSNRRSGCAIGGISVFLISYKKLLSNNCLNNRGFCSFFMLMNRKYHNNNYGLSYGTVVSYVHVLKTICLHGRGVNLIEFHCL